MFSTIRAGVLLTGLQRSFSQKAVTEASLKASLISNLAKSTLETQTNHSIEKILAEKKEPMSREEYTQKNLLSFDGYCQKIALPLIKRSCQNPQRAEELSAPSYLQRAYKGYCNGHYRGYVDSLDPMNPFIL